MNRIVQTDLFNLLSLISCSWDYGFADDIFFDAMSKITGNVTNEEIEEFAKTFLTDEMKKQGYGDEDFEVIKRTLVLWKQTYNE